MSRSRAREQQSEGAAAKLQRTRHRQHQDGSDEDPDDDPYRLRIIVAHEARRLAKLEAIDRTAAELAARRTERQQEVAQAIAGHGLSADDPQEFIEMHDDFK